MSLRLPIRLVSLAMILSGILLVVYGIASGEMQVALFLIFPVIYGTGILSLISLLLIFIGFFLTFLSFAIPPERIEVPYETMEMERPCSEEKPHVKGGGVVLIGPIPIIFGSDAKMAVIAMVLAIAMILLTLLLFL
ncbi:MAG: TIGR00304 family protein [Methanomassiliicoccales archaeon]|jgi:uncharacterized protein (TIGR00304 family)|nr:TIGR00304 family protein [Methanomassiliicoccales archaeon]